MIIITRENCVSAENIEFLTMALGAESAVPRRDPSHSACFFLRRSLDFCILASLFLAVNPAPMCFPFMLVRAVTPDVSAAILPTHACMCTHVSGMLKPEGQNLTFVFPLGFGGPFERLVLLSREHGGVEL